MAEQGLEQLIDELNRLDDKSAKDLKRRPFEGAQVVSKYEQLLLNLNSPEDDAEISAMKMILVSPENGSKNESPDSASLDTEQVLILELYIDGSYSMGRASPLGVSTRSASHSFMD